MTVTCIDDPGEGAGERPPFEGVTGDGANRIIGNETYEFCLARVRGIFHQRREAARRASGEARGKILRGSNRYRRRAVSQRKIKFDVRGRHGASADG